MKKILVLGAGLSTASLIDYLLKHARQENWMVQVGDVNINSAMEKVQGHALGESITFDVFNETDKTRYIQNADLVISMLPQRFHPMVAAACLDAGKSMLTASYLSPEIKRLDNQAKKKGLIFLNELGVDPGIDHMSAMRIIDRIRMEGGEITSFLSYTGGLIAPESDNNPWHYKFTWNPRNVVLAGQGTARYLRHGEIKYIPYHQLFRRTQKTSILELGEFEVYANRDSVNYREIYNLKAIPTLLRGTLRRPGFCEAWDIFVQLGMTDDSYILDNSRNMSCRQFLNCFLRYHPVDSVERKLARLFRLPEEGELMKKLGWLGIFSDKPIGTKEATPAQLLQNILEEKWKLDPHDQDMIVMQHVFEYTTNRHKYELKSSMVVKGVDQKQTAMAITVGTPIAIATRLVLNGMISLTGVQVPTTAELYNPILKELELYGVKFIEEERIIRE